MRFSTYLLSLILAFFTVQATQFQTPKRIRRSINLHSPVVLKQATRSQIVARLATRSRGDRTTPQKRQASAVPNNFPRSTCSFTSTGTTPYALFTGVDYAQADGAIYHPGVPTRDACIDFCQNNANCIISTYGQNNQDCYEVTKVGNYYAGPYGATVKGQTCEQLESVRAQFSGSTCCTEYRSP